MAHTKYMQIALSLAQIAYQNGDVPVGAVIVDSQGNIIGKGYNSKELNNNPLEHAEMIAIAMASQAIGQWRLKECTLYSTLEPCLMCVGAIIQSRITKVFFSVKDNNFGGLSSKQELWTNNHSYHKITYHQGLLEFAVKEILDNFFQEIRK